MIKKLKNIIERVITMKGSELMENNYADMTEVEKIEHDKAKNEFRGLYGKTKEVLTKEQLKVVNKCLDASGLISSLEQDYMFNRGVKMGLNELNFIRCYWQVLLEKFRQTILLNLSQYIFAI